MDFAAKHQPLVARGPQDLSYGGKVATISSHGVLITLNVSALPADTLTAHAKSKMRNGLLMLFFSCLSPDNNQDAHWVHKHLDVVFAKLSAKFGFEATLLN